MEWGAANIRLIVTTLRLSGGSGREPVGTSANVLGDYLRRAALRALAS